MSIVLLILTSFVSWFVSMLAGGGSPLILIPLVSFLLGSQTVAPIITTGMLLGNSQRIWLFWQDIDWRVTFWYLPGGIIGAFLGAYTSTQLELEWFQLVIGVFLVISVISFGFGKKERTFSVQAWQFLPAAFLYSFVSGLIGSSGPVLNPLYLNYGLIKEQMIATKAVNVVVIHLIKMVTYAAFGSLTTQNLGYGLIIGLSAVPANWIGQYLLSLLSEQQFRQLVLALMAISGLLMVWKERGLIVF